MTPILINPNLLTKFEGATMLSLTVDESNSVVSLASLGADLMLSGEVTLSLISNGVGSLSAVEAPQPYKQAPALKLDGLAYEGAPKAGRWYGEREDKDDEDYDIYVRSVEPRSKANGYHGLVSCSFSNGRNEDYDFDEFSEQNPYERDCDDPAPEYNDAPNEFIRSDDERSETEIHNHLFKVGDSLTRKTDNREFSIVRFGWGSHGNQAIYAVSVDLPKAYEFISASKKELQNWRYKNEPTRPAGLPKMTNAHPHAMGVEQDENSIAVPLIGSKPIGGDVSVGDVRICKTAVAGIVGDSYTVEDIKNIGEDEYPQMHLRHANGTLVVKDANNVNLSRYWIKAGAAQ